MHALTDFKGVRKNSKLLRHYLVGSLGATPDIREYLIPSYQEGSDEK